MMEVEIIEGLSTNHDMLLLDLRRVKVGVHLSLQR